MGIQSFLGTLSVNRNITREYRDLPEAFQGLGMFNLNVDNLGTRVYLFANPPHHATTRHLVNG